MREILIVDDVPENLHVLQLILKQPNHRVRAVTDGLVALKLAKEQVHHLIITDINMPGFSGYDLCLALKSDPELVHIPVIFVSALSDSDNIVKAFDIGGVDYITKPFKPAEILARVKTQFSLLDMKALQISQALSERMRQMVIGIAHEINTPLGTSITAVSFIQGLLKETADSYNAQRLEQETLEELLSSGEHSLSLTERSLLRLRACVDALKSISLAEKQGEQQVIELTTLMSNVEVMLRQRFNSQYVLNISTSDARIVVDVEKLQTAIFNIIENAIIHQPDPAKLAVVDVSLTCAHNQLNAVILDHCGGLQKTSIAQMLTPFFSTKRGSSNHIGLSASITESLITSGLMGSVSIVNEESGLCWSFSIPCAGKA